MTWERLINLLAGAAGVLLGFGLARYRVKRMRVTVEVDQRSLPPEE